MEFNCSCEKNTPPLVACESIFEIIRDNPHDIKYLIMCILPSKYGLDVLFYFRRAHKSLVIDFLSDILGSDFQSNLSLIKLSTLALCRSENLCINWDHYQSFEREKKEAVQKLFSEHTDMFEWNVQKEVNLWTIET